VCIGKVLSVSDCLRLGRRMGTTDGLWKSDLRDSTCYEKRKLRQNLAFHLEELNAALRTVNAQTSL
jgi:hypothetical protein